MALPSLATVDDLATWLGTTITDEDRAEAILTAASTLVRSTSGRSWVDADGEPEEGLTETELDAAHTVVLMVAARVRNNSEGVISQTSGPYSKTVAAWAAYGLELTDVEKGLISPAGGVAGLTSIRVVAPAAARGTLMYDADWWEEEADSEETE